MFSFIRSFISKKRQQREMEKKGLIGSRKRRKQDETLGQAADKSKSLGFIILTLLWVVCVTVLTIPNYRKSKLVLDKDGHALEQISSDINFSYEDIQKTNENRRIAVAAVPQYLKISPELTNECIDKIRKVFEEISRKNPSGNRSSQEFNSDSEYTVSAVVESLNNFEKEELQYLVKSKQQNSMFFNQLSLVLYKGIVGEKVKTQFTEDIIVRIIDHNGGVRKEQLLSTVPSPIQAAEIVADRTVKYYSHDNRKIIKSGIYKILLSTISSGNLIIDKERTDQERKEVTQAVPNVMVNVRKGDTIIMKGKLVDARDRKKHDKYLVEKVIQRSQENRWDKFLQASLICFLLMVITGIYISHIHPEVIRSNQKMWLIGTVSMVSIAINYGAIKVFYYINPTISLPDTMILNTVPVALAAILLSVLVGLRVALYVGLFVSIIAALQLDNSFNLLIDGLLVSCIAGFAVRDSLNYRTFFVRALLSVSLTLLFVDVVHLWGIENGNETFLWTLVLSTINASLTTVLALILLFFFESLFQVSTNMSLLLLSDYNHPLLKRLQFEAPGTYHHSLMVSTLAEQAAQEIGANSIKARVAALFHDIGKLNKPEYFTENSMGEKNKHSELHPRMSSLIILNHVKEGVDLALKYKLRKVIRDAIEQHHGTDIIYYFYKRAIEENKGKDIPVEEQEYAYPGPLPQEKEVVLISLADACEAASRSLQKASHGKIDALVWEIFRKRIRSGQLDEADLTFGELAKVRKSFVKTLTTMLHGRIAYPKDEENEEDEDDLFMAAKKDAMPKQETEETD